MATAQLMPIPVQTFTDGNGIPLAAGFLYAYAAGTTTPQATYTDQTGTVPNANPVVLNSIGQAQVWLSALAYKFVLMSSSGVTIWTVDNVSIINPLSLTLSMFPAGLFTATTPGRPPFTAGFETTALCDTVGPLLANSTDGRALMATNYLTKDKIASLGQQLSLSCGGFIGSATIATDVTNLTCTLTSVAGRPVFIGLIDDGSGSESSVGCSITGTFASIQLFILREVAGSGSWTQLASPSLTIRANGNGSNTLINSVPLSSVSHVDVTAVAGVSYTYKIQYLALTGSVTAGISYAQLLVYEMD